MIAAAVSEELIRDIHTITGASLRLCRPDESAGSDSGYYTFAIPDSGQDGLILETAGPNAEMAGRLFLHELALVQRFVKPAGDKTEFLRQVITGMIPDEALMQRAQKMHIGYDAARILLLTEVAEVDLHLAMRFITAIFSGPAKNQSVFLGGGRIATLHELSEGENSSELAHVLADTLHAEILTPVRVACSRQMVNLGEIPRAYRETCTALSVASVFMPDNYVIFCERLGLGRLIYGLDPELCRSFLDETTGGINVYDSLDADTITLIRHFFANNLNITDTAKELFLHRNTLIYRIDKIRQLTGFDLRRFEDAMVFQIAMLVSLRLTHLADQSK